MYKLTEKLFEQIIEYIMLELFPNDNETTIQLKIAVLKKKVAKEFNFPLLFKK